MEQESISQSANKLIEASNEFIEESSKVGYTFTSTEQYELERMIKILNNQIDMLVDYELKQLDK